VTQATKDTFEPAAQAFHPEAAVAPGYLANHAARVFNRLVDGRLREHGLTLSLTGPLLLLLWKGPMLQRDLVRHSAVKQPAMVASRSRFLSAPQTQDVLAQRCSQGRRCWNGRQAGLEYRARWP
jgi:hypothetical protein